MVEEIAWDREDEELVNPEGESRVNKTTASCSPQQTSLSGPPIAKANRLLVPGSSKKREY